MNIKQAKDEIKNTLTAYFTKNEFGDYAIKTEKQRPVFLVGPPGIGKTAIIEQIASEMKVGVISYSLTHHTRQSALGLPFISTKKYGDVEFEVSEYTMSEIIASVYDMIEKTGIKEGILFLDEINCVSETLSPIMLQFLQYKVFGKHKVPEGYIVVTAGNPPEYNTSAREFDVVTLDRLKKIDVDPEYDCWREYARESSVHSAITSYLDIKNNDFYHVASTVDGKNFATARGWEDLSQIIKLYEMHNIEVTETVIIQYIQSKGIANSFSIYYDLYKKYQSDYRIEDILNGEASDEIKSRALNSAFDERISVISLIVDSLRKKVTPIVVNDSEIYFEIIKEFNTTTFKDDETSVDVMTRILNNLRENNQNLLNAKAITKDELNRNVKVINSIDVASLPADKKEAFKSLKKYLDKANKSIAKESEKVSGQIGNGLKFCDETFKSGNEVVIFMTELANDSKFVEFIADYGCDEYFKHSKELLLNDVRSNLLSEIEQMQQ